MKAITNKLLSLTLLVATTVIISCDNDDSDIQKDLEVPESYEFVRDGVSSVNYSGQIQRLDMLGELGSYIGTAHESATLSEQTLLDMFANENNPFSSTELNESGKSLESKTFLAEVEFFQNVLKSAAAASASSTPAAEGQAGLIARGPDRNILVNEKGWEYTQIVQKGIMGATFLNQIYNVYLTDARIGNGVDNENLVEGTNYTPMEHHWDEAFGYWGVNVDFDPEGENRYWGNYTFGREAYTNSATALKDAFLTGRTAIVNKDYELRDAQRQIIYEEFELVVAATVIHYLNESITDFNNGDQGNLFHHASEGYGFAMGLKYSPFRKITNEQLDTILNENLGDAGDFWSITVDGLNQAKTTLIQVYPSLADVADEL